MSDNASTDRDTIEQLADSFATRFRAGERPSVDEFAKKYPELAGEVRELLPALVLLEQNAATEDSGAFAPFSGSTLPREIGDFMILREIGRGGMGVVYEAVQQSLGRHVALKVLSTPGLLNPTHRERFQLEARAAARLHHTHIVPVFGVGEHNGLHYYAMQFIQGQSLDLVIDELRRLRRPLDQDATTPGADDTLTQFVADGMLTGCFQAGEDKSSHSDASLQNAKSSHAENRPRDGKETSVHSHSGFTSSHSGREFYHSVARVGLQVAEALDYAHAEGILHRDIKPSNVLLDAKGSVWISDFGLAKAEGSDGLTEAGDFVGTLRYMAPERLEGWSDRRSDLYSLGATLYELLTLRPFLETPSRGQLVDRILNSSPHAPSKFDPSIPRDLETIILKAIAKEPAARYLTAGAMADDLERYLAYRPILARRSTPTEQFVRWCRRNPLAALLTGAVTLLLIAAVAILATSNASIRRESAARAAALQEKDTALGAARSAIKQMLIRAGDEIVTETPTTNPLRQALLEDSNGFYQGVIEQAAQDSSLHFELARVLQKMSIVQINLRRWDDAQRSVERSVELIEKLNATSPREFEHREILAENYFILGFLWHKGPSESGAQRAEQHYRKSLEIFNALEREQPARLQGVCGVLKYLAECAAAKDDNAAAVKLLREAIRRGEDYLIEHPTDVVARVHLGWCYSDIGHQTSQGEERDSMLGAAVSHAQIAARYPPRNIGRQALGELKLLLADDRRKSGRTEEALALCQQAVLDAQAVYTVNSIGSGTWHHIECAFADRIVPWLRELGRDQEVSFWVDRYRDCFESIMPDDPDPATQDEVWRCQQRLVALLRSIGQEKEAGEVLQRSFERLARNDASADNHPDYGWWLAWRGIAHCELGRWNEALADFKQAERCNAQLDKLPVGTLLRDIPWNRESTHAPHDKESEELRAYLADIVERKPAVANRLAAPSETQSGASRAAKSIFHGGAKATEKNVE